MPRGRPKKYGDDRATQITVYMPLELLARIDEERQKMGISRSQYVNYVLASAVDKELVLALIESYKELGQKIEDASPTQVLQKIPDMLPNELKEWIHKATVRIASMWAKQGRPATAPAIYDTIEKTTENLLIGHGLWIKNKRLFKALVVREIQRALTPSSASGSSGPASGN